MRWRKQSFFIMVTSLAIAFVVWSQMGMYMAHLLFGVSIQVNFFKFCISLFRENSLYYFLVIVLLNALIAYTVLLTVIKAAQQYLLVKRFKKKLIQLQNMELTALLNEDCRRERNDIMVVHDDQSLAFTVGFFQPTIVLSSGLLEMLDDNELEAVIEHETFHQKNYDGLKIFLLQMISKSLPFIPLTKWAYENYKIMSELRADEYAILQTGSELGLGSALVKLIRNYMDEARIPMLVHFADESVNYRLQQLVNPKNTMPIQIKTASIVISIHMLLLFIAMVVVTVG